MRKSIKALCTVVLSLNPYSTGRYSMRDVINELSFIGKTCLNPYSTGRYSMRLNTEVVTLNIVSCHNPYSTGRYSMRGFLGC